MSIASQITALGTDKTDIANAITAKGGTLSQNPGFDTFAADISTIRNSDQYFYEYFTVSETAKYTKIFELDFEPKYIFFAYANSSGVFRASINNATITNHINEALYCASYVKMNTAQGQNYSIYSYGYVGKDTSGVVSYNLNNQSGAFQLSFNSETNKWELKFGREPITTQQGITYDFQIIGGLSQTYQVFVGG